MIRKPGAKKSLTGLTEGMGGTEPKLDPFGWPIPRAQFMVDPALRELVLEQHPAAPR